MASQDNPRQSPCGDSQRRIVTRTDFVKLCEFLRKNAKDLLTARPSLKEFNRLYANEIGFFVSEKAMREARTVVGVNWVARRPQPFNEERKRRLEVVVRQVKILLDKLGEKPTKEFADLCNIGG